jgi:hypothetical protein
MYNKKHLITGNEPHANNNLKNIISIHQIIVDQTRVPLSKYINKKPIIMDKKLSYLE